MESKSNFKNTSSFKERENYRSRNFENQSNPSDPNKVPNLNWSSHVTRNNFHDWKDKLLIYAAMNYKYMSHILENDEEYPIAEVPQPTAARRLGEVEKIMFQTALNQFNVTTLAYQAEKLPFFTFVLSHLSENSKTILMRDEHYNQYL
jgi:hypothetical protein